MNVFARLTPRDWVKAVFLAVPWHFLLALSGNFLANRGMLSNNLSLAFLVADLPGILAILYQFLSVLIGVLAGGYGPRALKAAAILATGPLATLYLGWNHERYRRRG
jgi:hypothetical protein